MRVLIASCIRQKPEILREFLKGLDELEKPDDTEFYFTLHNISTDEDNVISGFSEDKIGRVIVKTYNDDVPYERDDSSTHKWGVAAVDKVIEMKNDILQFAREGDYDYLYFTDSDQVMHPKTLLHLISREKDIVGEICWSKWEPDQPESPNAWFEHPYGFNGRMNHLRTEGLIKVAGFGGCYLISKKALTAGVNFSKIKGVPHAGEDRHFHIRAGLFGFDSYIDTTYPYFHIYRDSDLEKLHIWKENDCIFPKVKLKKGSVLIGICVGETGIHPDLAIWLIKTLKKHPDWGLDINRMHPIDSNRNAITKKFLTLHEAKKYEYLLFVDTDVVPPDNAVEKLLEYDKKVVGGVCFIMGTDGIPIPNISINLSKGHYRAELIEVEGMGTGFILIHREVLEAIGESPFRFRYDDWGLATVCGEDYDFCEKAVNKGYKIYADLSTQCSHYKQVDLTRLNKRLGALLSGDTKYERRPTKSVESNPSGSISDSG